MGASIRKVHMKPTKPGKLGDIEFDGTTTWVCMGGTDWTNHIERELPAPFPFQPPLRRRREKKRGFGILLVRMR